MFNTGWQPRDDGEVHQINLIDTIMDQQEEDSVGRYLEILFEEVNVQEEEVCGLGSQEPKFEESPPIEKQALSLTVQPPKPELKPLLSTLKYAYLGSDGTFLVVINSSLLHDKKSRLL